MKTAAETAAEIAVNAANASSRAEESALSSWAGPYVTDMLGRGSALATQMPYTAYQGPLTAGPSALQTQAYQGLGSLGMPANMGAYNPMSFTGAGYQPLTAEQLAGGDTPTYTPASGNTLQQYMTPYLQGVLNPQYDAARRQSAIQAQTLQSQYGKAGAYGGSRQGVAEAELQRGLLDRMSGITGQGYQDAFTQAQSQFNTEQDRARQAQDMANQYGFNVSNAQQLAGTAQRGIEQEGMMADMAQFEQERDYPYKQVQFMNSLLQGLPIETQAYSYTQPSGLQNLAGTAGTAKSILDALKEFWSPAATAPATAQPPVNGTAQQWNDWYMSTQP